MTANKQDYNHFRISVPIEFEDVFSHFYFAENNSLQPLTKMLLPSYQTILIFCFGSNASLITKQHTKIQIDKCLVLGPIKQSFEYTLAVGAEILVANFKDDAFYRFFGNVVLSHHIAVDPDDLLKENCFTNLWHDLIKINNATERVNYILNFCKPYLKDRNKTLEKLIAFGNEAYDPIKAIAQETAQSERNVQLKHKQHLGYSAKEINRFRRFLKAVELIKGIAENSEKTSWFEVISECGYYDQSQLIHDFKHFINLSPRQFLKLEQDVCNPVT